MAEYKANVLLGFEDEAILDKHNLVVNFTTNKIGGKPDWPTNIETKTPICPLCELPRPLVLQIYAPLDNSQYHRTLYLFACINPNCWNQNESWTCLRYQVVDQKSETGNVSVATNSNVLSVTDWCQDADDWDDNNANGNEENGNVINAAPGAQEHDGSDDEDESCSFEEQIRVGLGHLTVDERNANTGQDVEGVGAVGRQLSPIATAEIEVDESEVVVSEGLVGVGASGDVRELLAEAAPLPSDVRRGVAPRFSPAFLHVAEEWVSGAGGPGDAHIRDLLHQYQQRCDPDLQLDAACPHPDNHNDGATGERYERSAPAHGDKLFHYFVTRIQQNPGQILRYERGGRPLLLQPVQETARRCRYCQAELLFELQVLPTLIPKLRLVGDETRAAHLEFGTVLLFTCSRSCWPSDATTREETIIVQSETY